MRKAAKIWLVVGTVLVVVGVALFTLAMTVGEGSLSLLQTASYTSRTYPVEESFRNISMDTQTVDIRFVRSEDGACSVVCDEQEDEMYAVSVQEDTLSIRLVEEKKWYAYIGMNLRKPQITVYLPDAEYDMLWIEESTGLVEISDAFRFSSVDISTSTGAVANAASVDGLLRVQTNTGDIRVENVSAGEMELSVSTGAVTVRSVKCTGDLRVFVSTGETWVENTTCQNLISNGTTGDVTLLSVLAGQFFSIVRSTGKVCFEECDASALSVRTDTGDVTGSLLSDKVFLTQTSTGKVTVPQNATGGTCEISTSTGDIHVEVLA